jgi:hypothetical protein
MADILGGGSGSPPLQPDSPIGVGTERPPCIGDARVTHTDVARATCGERPAPLAAVHADCPATVEDQLHDQLITRCLDLYRAGKLPV